jgi:hypothetical protein
MQPHRTLAADGGALTILKIISLSRHRVKRAVEVRAFVTQIVGALSPAMIGYLVALTGGFTGAFAVLAVAVVISAGCMIVLAMEGL